MGLTNVIRRVLSEQTKVAVANALPWLYALYERRFIKKTLGLQQFYDAQRDCLNVHGALFDMKQLASSKLVGVFNSEYADIIQDYAFPEKREEKKYRIMKDLMSTVW